jgi:hypothetical protein
MMHSQTTLEDMMVAVLGRELTMLLEPGCVEKAIISRGRRSQIRILIGDIQS